AMAWTARSCSPSPPSDPAGPWARQGAPTQAATTPASQVRRSTFSPDRESLLNRVPISLPPGLPLFGGRHAVGDSPCDPEWTSMEGFPPLRVIAFYININQYPRVRGPESPPRSGPGQLTLMTDCRVRQDRFPSSRLDAARARKFARSAGWAGLHEGHEPSDF